MSSVRKNACKGARRNKLAKMLGGKKNEKNEPEGKKKNVKSGVKTSKKRGACLKHLRKKGEH